MESVRRALLEKALGFYEKLLVQEGDDPAIRFEAGRAYRRVGDLRSQLGENKRALAAYSSSIEILGSLVASRPSDLESRRELAERHLRLGRTLARTGRPQEAEREFRESIAMRRDIIERSSSEPDDRLAWAECQGALGTFLWKTGRLGEAREVYRRVRDVLERLVGDFPNNARYQSVLGAALNDLGCIVLEQSDKAEARAFFQQAVKHQQAALAVDPKNINYRIYARNHQENLALLLNGLGQQSEAQNSLRECIAIGAKLATDFPLMPRYREELAESYANLSVMLSSIGPDRRAEAIDLCGQAVKLFQELVSGNPEVSRYRRGLAGVRNNLGELFRKAQRWNDAEQTFRA